jgi:hypothetical protein
MQGSVYSLARRGHFGDLAHPHLIVVLKSPTQALCVPGFTPGKPAHSAAKNAAQRDNLWGNRFEVLVDHRACLQNAATWRDLHVCSYVVAAATPIEVKTLIREGQKWGDMIDSAVRKVAEGILEHHKEKGSRLKREVDLLEQLIAAKL